MPSSLPMVLLDKGLFQQALVNLFVNARQAMPDGGELIVEGIKTNTDLHRELVRDGEFRRGGVSIHYLEKKLNS